MYGLLTVFVAWRFLPPVATQQTPCVVLDLQLYPWYCETYGDSVFLPFYISKRKRVTLDFLLKPFWDTASVSLPFLYIIDFRGRLKVYVDGELLWVSEKDSGSSCIPMRSSWKRLKIVLEKGRQAYIGILQGVYLAKVPCLLPMASRKVIYSSGEVKYFSVGNYGYWLMVLLWLFFGVYRTILLRWVLWFFVLGWVGNFLLFMGWLSHWGWMEAAAVVLLWDVWRGFWMGWWSILLQKPWRYSLQPYKKADYYFLMASALLLIFSLYEVDLWTRVITLLLIWGGRSIYLMYGWYRLRWDRWYGIILYFCLLEVVPLLILIRL